MGYHYTGTLRKLSGKGKINKLNLLIRSLFHSERIKTIVEISKENLQYHNMQSEAHWTSLQETFLQGLEALKKFFNFKNPHIWFFPQQILIPQFWIFHVILLTFIASTLWYNPSRHLLNLNEVVYNKKRFFLFSNVNFVYENFFLDWLNFIDS